MGLLAVLTLARFEIDFLALSPSLAGLAIFLGWILFGIVLHERIRGMSFVLCLIGYPLAQFAICFTVFFFGCLVFAG